MSQRFAPGDLITSALINNLLDRLEIIESRNSDARLVLGQLGANTHTLVALSTGFETGGGIFLDGQPLLAGPPTRGVNLVILNPSLVVKFRGTYDTFATPSESTRLANDLKTQTARYDIVVAVTHDSYTTNLQAGAKAALAAVGGAAIGTATQTHDSAAFIGVVPNNKTIASFNYLVSVVPADVPNNAGQLVAALPFVWGIYSIPLQRFIMGGGSDTSLPSAPKQDKESKEAKDKDAKEGKESKDKDSKESKDKDSKESKDKDSKESKDKDSKESKDKDSKESKDKDSKESKDKDSKESKDKDSKESKDKDSKESKDKDSKEAKDKDSKDAKEASKDNKDNKEHKEDKEDSDKTGKEALSFAEKTRDQIPISEQSGFSYEAAGDPSVFDFSGADDDADLPLGKAFIPPQERPAVGRKALDAADKSEEIH